MLKSELLFVKKAKINGLWTKFFTEVNIAIGCNWFCPCVFDFFHNASQFNLFFWYLNLDQQIPLTSFKLTQAFRVLEDWFWPFYTEQPVTLRYLPYFINCSHNAYRKRQTYISLRPSIIPQTVLFYYTWRR